MKNVHDRLLPTDPDSAGELLDSISSRQDRLWPSARWPAMRLDRPLGPGARGGHGPIRYEVEEWVPGTRVVFRFARGLGIDGTHRCDVMAAANGHTLLRHTLEGRTYGRMRLAWPLVFRWLHDALIEDLLDRAEASARGVDWRPRALSPPVRALRWSVTRASSRGPRIRERAPQP